MIPDSLRTTLRRKLRRFQWDQRARNLMVARLLDEAVHRSDEGRSGPALLDVGCGNGDFARFLGDREVEGIDLADPVDPPPNLRFRRGDATSLPFADRSFSYVTCVDVLEHLPVELRAKAIAEIVRVARDGIILAFPNGPPASACDSEFRLRCEARGVAVPEWVTEHLSQTFPTVEEVSRLVQENARQSGRTAQFAIHRAEPLILARMQRRAAAHSRLAFLATNYAFSLVPVRWEHDDLQYYRAIVVAPLS